MNSISLICLLVAIGPPTEEPASRWSGEHWAFRSPAEVTVPRVAQTAWPHHEIDAFIAAEQSKRGLSPAPPAEKHLLLRRVYFDLIGLPPTREELHAFLADDSPDAYEKVVDKLLESPRYGERWGRHWMDVWRYSDWAGYGMEIRQSQRHIWRWRDWIVESLNRDKPYDRMIVEMLAGDEVAPTDPETLRATGFLARSWFKFSRNVWLDNVVEHTSKAFLGITLNCARCHEHKYDAISQDEYYQFRAFFEPHNVRTDRVPGQPDVMQDGLPRVFDTDLAAPTFLFVRGDEAQPAKDMALSPAVPAVLRGSVLSIRPVSLPATAYYPGLQPFVQQETLGQADAAVAKAQASLDQANKAVLEAKQRLDVKVEPLLESVRLAEDASGKLAASTVLTAAEAETAVRRAKRAAELAERQLVTARAKQHSVETRIVADRAGYAIPPAPQADALAGEAARVEREANAREAQENLLRAEQQLADAAAAAKPHDAKSKEAVANADKKLNEACEKAKTASAALKNSDAKYAPLSEVFPATSSGRRLALARWIASRDNPLTARVAVNHIWLRHFGRPLVPTVFEFGVAGQRPTHPELLDWLAVEFMDHDWSMKHLHRLIVTSNTYRMASGVGVQGSGFRVQESEVRSQEPQGRGPRSGEPLTTHHSPLTTHQTNATIDPENIFLWRQNPRRMEAEIVRDSVLHVAGQLDKTIGGPEIDHNQGQTSRRRSVYFRTAYEKQMTLLALFDQASPTECYRRSESVVPQQALAMANSQLTLDQSRLLARSISQQVGSESILKSDESFVSIAFERVLGRPPGREELSECLSFLAAQTKLLARPASLTAVQAGAAATVKPAAEPHQRARENLVHVLLNHNEFVTIR